MPPRCEAWPRHAIVADSLQFLTHVARAGAYPLEDERLGKGVQMSQTEYVLHHTGDQRELDRLRTIEVVFDPASQRRIRSTGFTHGWRCLEVGAGAGSVASWMASVSGLSGHTTAIDRKRNKKVAVQPCLETYECKIRGEEQWHWPPRGEADAHNSQSMP